MVEVRRLLFHVLRTIAGSSISSDDGAFLLFIYTRHSWLRLLFLLLRRNAVSEREHQ